MNLTSLALQGTKAQDGIGPTTTGATTRPSIVAAQETITTSHRHPGLIPRVVSSPASTRTSPRDRPRNTLHLRQPHQTTDPAAQSPTATATPRQPSRAAPARPTRTTSSPPATGAGTPAAAADGTGKRSTATTRAESQRRRRRQRRRRGRSPASAGARSSTGASETQTGSHTMNTCVLTREP